MEKVKLLFGQQEIKSYLETGFLTDELKLINSKIYEFNSDIEKIAFLKGINEAIGWQEVLEL